MARVRLRSLSGVESRMLRDKLREPYLSARVHQRYRVVSEVLKGHSVAETADWVGCHSELVEVALSSPAKRGLPVSNWSVKKLSEYCRSKGLLPPVTDEWVRRLLRRERLTA